MSKKKYIRIYGPFAELHVALAIFFIGMPFVGMIPVAFSGHSFAWWYFGMYAAVFLLGLSFAISAWYCFRHQGLGDHSQVRGE